MYIILYGCWEPEEAEGFTSLVRGVHFRLSACFEQLEHWGCMDLSFSF